MKKTRLWESYGWPWGLELLSVLFVAAILIIPVVLSTEPAQDVDALSLAEQFQMERRTTPTTYEDQRNFFWGLGIVGLYVVHLLMAYSSLTMISTTFMHLFSPLIFSVFAYIRLTGVTVGPESVPIVTGATLEFIPWGVLVLSCTLLLARWRMLRHLRDYNQLDWQVISPTLRDKTWLSDLAVTMTPIVYPPKEYRACDDGILIVGWLYVYPLSFKTIQSIESVRRPSLTGRSDFFATSSKSLVRIQRKDSNAPLYISPKDRNAFIAYCNQHLHRGVVSLSRDDTDDDNEH